jgi:hypothetical protein
LPRLVGKGCPGRDEPALARVGNGDDASLDPLTKNAPVALKRTHRLPILNLEPTRLGASRVYGHR